VKTNVTYHPDPLSDEYPRASPYMYCGGNPIIFKEATIMVPNERVCFSESVEIGAYKAKYANKYGEYKRNENS
jgi:hypothetical protein